MEELKDDIGTVSDNTKKLVDTEMKLLKLQAVDHFSAYAASAFSRFLFTVMGMVAYGAVIAALGLYLNQLLHSDYLGLLCAAGISLALIMILFMGRRLLIERPIQNMIINDLAKRVNL